MRTPKPSHDQEEIDRFDQLAKTWWDDNGPMRPLHEMNPARLSFIRKHIDQILGRNQHGQRTLDKLSILDIGCGGGILCEPFARLGAHVTGIDLSQELIDVASHHAQQSDLNIDYRCQSAESLLQEKKRFDIVTALEVIEHVPNPEAFINTTTKLLKPKGMFFLSTLNRTPAAYLTAIIGAEYVLRWLPKGTHQWDKFIKPSEMKTFFDQTLFDIHDISGIVYHPLKQEFILKKNRLSVNYILCAVKK